ncbi:hypothetical protein BDV27DRAFT_152214 [Aspergillus caelatus]|uniref:Uncharacterized protein n=1 Tax=Aspergillus caelatus TaxID=61420 RepID=A0A5N7AMW2_9EURO|nr:uncharacterized protein BDV27DRAFT_152214 [Aspergillus caelatus]KAE8370329.1 hypothetical protein BDV27DRAFT_152214 [Aspergillus caelatus]
MFRSLSRLTGSLAHLRLRDDREAQREKAFGVLCGMFTLLKNMSSVYIQPGDFQSLPVSIDMKVLPLNDVTIEETPCVTVQTELNFFLPLSHESISSKYKMNLEAPEISERFSHVNQLTDGNCPVLMELGCWTKQEHLDYLAYRLMWEADVVPRMGTEGNSRPLRVVTGWKSPGFAFAARFEPYLHTYDSPYSEPANCWVKSGIPHTKIAVYNTSQGDPKLLLCSEILTIIAAIATRLMDKWLEKHLIIPVGKSFPSNAISLRLFVSSLLTFILFEVMLISFMAPAHGRVIIAHYDSKGLRIKMSDLMLCSSKDRASWDFFARYLGSDANPTADTSMFVD